MKSILTIIKKFFFALFSIIFGIFNNDKKINQKQTKSVNNISKKNLKNSKPVQKHQDLVGSCNQSAGQKVMFSHIKNDLYILFLLVKELENIDIKLSSPIKYEDLVDLEKEIKSIKIDIQCLENKYDKINSSNEAVKDIISKIQECKNLASESEDKIEKIKNQKDNQQKVETKKQKETVKPKIVSKDSIKPENNIKQEKPKKAIKKENTETKSSKTSKTKIKNTILETISVIEFKELEVKKPVIEKQNKNNNIKVGSVDKKESTKNIEVDLNKQKKTVTTKKVIYFRKIKQKPKKVVNMKRKITVLSEKNKLRRISKYIKSALKLVMMLEVANEQLSQNVIFNNLIVNNYIRKARNIKNRKVKALKYATVVKKVNPPNSLVGQLNYIKADSLTQIRKLRQELLKMDRSEIIEQLLNELDEIESSIIQNLNKTIQEETKTR